MRNRFHPRELVFHRNYLLSLVISGIETHSDEVSFAQGLWRLMMDSLSMVSCQKGPTSHAYAWQIGPFWQDTPTISLANEAGGEYILDPPMPLWVCLSVCRCHGFRNIAAVLLKFKVQKHILYNATVWKPSDFRGFFYDLFCTEILI